MGRDLLARQLGQRATGFHCSANQTADHSVGLAERQPAPHEEVRDVGGGEHLVGGSLGKALAIEGHPGEHFSAASRHVSIVSTASKSASFLLQILGVGERQGVKHADQGRERGGHPRRLAAQSSAASGFFLAA